jgi:hypothetical protein
VAQNLGLHLNEVQHPPQTEMWRELDSGYGIFEKDWSKDDTKHLVWNHPHCKPGIWKRCSRNVSVLAAASRAAAV